MVLRARSVQDIVGLLPAAKSTGLRRLFPALKSQVYLDIARCSPLSLPVLDALTSHHSDAAAAGAPRSDWFELAERTRAAVSRLLNAGPDEIAFTKNTSEGLIAAAWALPLAAGDNVVALAEDHPNLRAAFAGLRARGVELRLCDGGRGLPDAAAFAPALDARTRAIAVSHVLSHDGRVADLQSISGLCQARGLHLVVDAVQSIGVLAFDVARLRPSFVAFGCNKGLLTPPGLGVLYCRADLELRSAHYAGTGLVDPRLAGRPGERMKPGARRFETGIANYAGLAGLEAALRLIDGVGRAAITDHVLGLGAHLRASLRRAGLPAPIAPCGSHIHVLPVDGTFGERLAQRRVRVSQEEGGVRLSLALFSTPDDVDQAVGHLQALSAGRDAALTPHTTPGGSR